MSNIIYVKNYLGPIAQSVVSLTADPGVASWIRALYRTYFHGDNDHDLISTVILLLPLDSRKVAVSYKRMYVHEILVTRIFKLAQEKVWLGELRPSRHDHSC